MIFQMWKELNMDLKMPNLKMPEIKIPNLNLSELKFPDIKLPEIKLPDFKLPEIKMPSLSIGKLTARIPIIQGGMSVGISLSKLASAVAIAGGIGVIGAAAIGMLEPDFNKHYKTANKRALTKELNSARSLTDGIIGVNIMLALTDFDELARVSLEEGADLLFLGAGLPLHAPKTLNPERLEDYATKVVPIVSSGKAARIILNYWSRNYDNVPDAVVVEGPLAGGHLGFKKNQIQNPEFSLEKLVTDVIEEVKQFEQQYSKPIPVIAAGGVFSGADILKFLQLGANGVQMATRFVATHECDASLEFKEKFVNCKEGDIVIIESPVGLPGRAIKNEFIEGIEAGDKKPFNCPWKCLKSCEFKTAPYCIALALTNAKVGKTHDGFCFAGANAHKIDKIVSVKELVDTLQEEYAVAYKQAYI